jgi:hypothetical protein
MQIMVKQEITGKKKKEPEELISLPKAAEPLFSTVALPIWIANYYSQGDGWKTPGDNFRQILQDICDHIYGETLRLEIGENTEAWKRVSLVDLLTDFLIFYQGWYETMGLPKSNEGQGYAGG